MQRADDITQSNWFQIRNDRPGTATSAARSVNFNQWAGWNFDGDLRYTGANINAHWIARRTTGSSAAASTSTRRASPIGSTRGGPVGVHRPVS